MLMQRTLTVLKAKITPSLESGLVVDVSANPSTSIGEPKPKVDVGLNETLMALLKILVGWDRLSLGLVKRI